MSDNAPPPALAAASQAAAARRFWMIVESKIKSQIERAMPHAVIEVDSIQFPLFIPTFIPGLIGSIIVHFPCRIVAWTIESVAGGTITVDIRRSAALTHPTMDSLPGSAPLFPTIAGFYMDSATFPVDPMASWVEVNLARGDMLHCYVTASTAPWVDGTLALKVRRLA